MTIEEPPATPDRRRLVDTLIDHGLELSIATDWSLTLPQDWLPDLPLDADRLDRPRDVHRSGYFRAPVYRGLELVAQPLALPVLILTDASGLLQPVYLNTETGAIARDLAAIGLHPHPPTR